MRPPRIVNSRGVRYDLSLLKITARDELGRPTETRIVYDEEVLENFMTEQEKERRRVEFILVYLPHEFIVPQTKGEA